MKIEPTIKTRSKYSYSYGRGNKMIKIEKGGRLFNNEKV